MNRYSRKFAFPFVIAIFVFFLSMAWVATAVAAPTVPLRGGVTKVKLSGVFVDTLAALEITPDDIAPGHLSRRGTARFPIPGGGLDFGYEPPAGEIIHTGGLTLTDKFGTTVGLLNFIIDTTSSELTGQVTANGDLVARVPLFDLDFADAGIKTRGNRVLVRNVAVTLSSAAADALNAVFFPGQDPVFPAGFEVGVAKVYFRLPHHHGFDFDDD